MTNDQIAPLARLPADVAIEPVYNALNSLALLNRDEPPDDPRGWLARTAAALTPEQRRANRLLLGPLRDALTPEHDWPDFPAYLERLAQHNPRALRDRALERLARSAPGQPAAPDPAQMLADPAAYAAQVARLYPGAADPELTAEAHALLGDPPRLHETLVAHTATLWEQALADEWARALHGRIGSLQHQAQVFRQCLDPASPVGATIAPLGWPDAPQTAAEAFRTCTGREPPAALWRAAGEVRRIILVPAPHNGRSASTWYAEGVLRAFFSAPQNYPAIQRSSPVGLPELRTRTSALADDVRLRILELIAQHGELSAQEIIARLGLTQPTVSRHLKQLQTYLFERRGEGANKLYSLNAVDLTITVRAIERLLAGATAFSADAAPEERAEQPPEVRRFLDAEGRVDFWPAKLKEQAVVLRHLAELFAPGHVYSEQEVNELLARAVAPGHTTERHNRADLGFSGVIDFVTLRRELCNQRLLERERDGSRYWRAEG